MKAKEYRKEKDFINELYGVSDEDHETALEPNHYFGAMEDYAKEKAKISNMELLGLIERYGIEKIKKDFYGSDTRNFETP